MWDVEYGVGGNSSLEAHSRASTGWIPQVDGRRFAAVFALMLCAVLLAPRTTTAQVTRDTARTAAPDSALIALADTLARLPRPAAPAAASDLTAPLSFSATDSLVLVFSDSLGDRGRLVGATRVTYDDVELDAYAVTMLLDRDEVHAEGLRADTGWVGRPAFKQGDETFEGDRLAYNLRTERGRVLGAQTSYEEGGIRADIVKVGADGTLYIQDGLYTTCPCVEDPSYSLRAGRMKVVDDKIYTGPIQLYLFNIPAPLWLPFGFLPTQEGRRSGPLAPQYGEDQRGFFLKDWGWYFALSDYLDLQLRGGIWTTGSWDAASTLRYNRRYRYQGSLDLSYGRQRNGESGDPGFQVIRSSKIRWIHGQTLSPTSSFDANVNLTSQSYLQTVSESFEDRASQTVSSQIGYEKRWTNSGRRLSLDLSQRQVFATEVTDLTLPTVSFTQSQRTPFSRSTRPPGSSERWYEKIAYSYSFRLRNEFRFVPLSDEILAESGDPDAGDITWAEALFDADAYRRATGDDEQFDFSANHSIPVTASFALGRVPLIGRIPINLTPRLTYTEDWYIRSERRSVDTSGTIVTSSVPGFVALRQFSSGLGANTTFYGIFPFKLGPYDGLRHTVRPSVSFSYAPDFSEDRFGYTRTVTDTAGVVQTYPVVSGVRSGKSQTLGFSLSNVFETRRTVPDTAATGAPPSPRPVQLLTLNASASYNFAADDFKLSDVQANARTQLFGKVQINANATLTPYAFATDSLGVSTRLDRLLVSERGLRFARLTTFRVTASTRLASGRQRGTSRPAQVGRALPFPGSTEPPTDAAQRLVQQASAATAGRYQAPVDFAIPWSLGVDFSYGIARPFLTSTRTAVINATYDFSLTPRWKVTGRTGYDLELGEVSTTNFALYRDFDCWQLRLNWTPLGRYQSYGFELQVKSGQLRELLRIQQPRQDIKDRFSSVLN